MRLHTVSCNVGYPLYGARFLEDNTLLIAGGGGEGRNGIPNKLSLLRIQNRKSETRSSAGTHEGKVDDKSISKTFKSKDDVSGGNKGKRRNETGEVLGRSQDDENFTIEKLNEYEFDPQDDSPTALDCREGSILVGCNENSEKISQGKGNHHLRKLELKKLGEGSYKFKFIRGIDYDKSTDPNEYTKLIHISRVGSLAAIASSCSPSTLRIINYKTMEEKYEIESTDEIKDLNFSPDGKVISYITSKSLELISTVTGSSFTRKVDFDRNWNLSKIRFIDNHTLVVGASLIKGNGILLLKIDVKSGKATLSKTKLLSKQFRGITAMDVNGYGNLAALATNDNSLLLVRLNRIRVKKILRQIHSFAITKVTISRDCKFVATVSAANTVHVVEIPENFASSLSAPEFLYQLFTKSVTVLIVAIFIQYAYQYQLHSKIIHGVRMVWQSENLSYFINGGYASENSLDYFEQKTLIGDYGRPVDLGEQQEPVHERQYWEYHEEYPVSVQPSEEQVEEVEQSERVLGQQSNVRELEEEQLEGIVQFSEGDKSEEQIEQPAETWTTEQHESEHEEQSQQIVESSEVNGQEQEQEHNSGQEYEEEQKRDEEETSGSYQEGIIDPHVNVEEQLHEKSEEEIHDQGTPSEQPRSEVQEVDNVDSNARELGEQNGDQESEQQRYEEFHRQEQKQEQEQKREEEQEQKSKVDEFQEQSRTFPSEDQQQNDNQQTIEQDLGSEQNNEHVQNQEQEPYQEEQHEPEREREDHDPQVHQQQEGAKHPQERGESSEAQDESP